MKKLTHYFIFQEHSAFMPLRYAYPECSLLIEPHPNIQPLQCYKTSCPANKNCADITANRVHYLFVEVFDAAVEVLFLYFKLRDRGFWYYNEWIPSLGAGVFYKDMREPTWMKLNRWGFNKVRDGGVPMSWMPADEFLFLGGSSKEIVTTTKQLELADD